MTTVLIVEDDEILLENVALELKMNGYEVLEAENGERALEIIRDEGRQPDIIVSDISMPGLGGFELLSEIRNDESLNAIPLLFVTAMSSPDSIRRGKQLGADDYIVKPFSVEDLIIALENKLSRSAAYRHQANKEVNALRQNLLKMLAHELRTPLVPIQGGAELLAGHLSDMPDEYVKSMLALIQNGVGRISRLAERTRALLDLDSGNFASLITRDGTICNLCDVAIAARVAVEKERIFHANAPFINVSDCDKPLFVDGIYRYLQLMLEEPLRNAVEFAPPDSVVRVDLARNEEHVTLSIVDDGPGIAPEHLERVWVRFEQIDRARREQQGAGIGLALARETARAHGGECRLESTPGKGTRVIFELPLAEREVSEGRIDEWGNLGG